MKYAIKMGPGVMTCLPIFMKTGSGIVKVIDRDTQAAK
jgi:hypothetical protein